MLTFFRTLFFREYLNFYLKTPNAKFNGSPSSAGQKFFSASLQPQLPALKKIFWPADVKGATK